MIRINVYQHLGKERALLLQHWARILSEEYDLNSTQAFKYVKGPDMDHLNFVCEMLKNQGWKVGCFRLPGNHVETGIRCLGYEIDENCDAYISWRLSQTP